MQRDKITYRLLLAIVLTVASNGCAQLYCLPDDCAAVVYECDLARLAHDLCSDQPFPDCASPVGCGSINEDCIDEDCNAEPEAVYESSPPQPGPLKVCQRLRQRKYVESGPPPVTIRPAMPPKFFPVPTGPVFSRVNMQATGPARGTVEVGNNSQLSFPGSY